MKMLGRYNRINLIATIIIFLLSGIAFYFLLGFVLIEQVDEDLRIEQKEILSYSAKYQRLPENMPVKDQEISYQPIEQPIHKRIFRTIVSPELIKKKEDSRELIFSVQVG